jgi:hypothetical protein
MFFQFGCKGMKKKSDKRSLSAKKHKKYGHHLSAMTVYYAWTLCLSQLVDVNAKARLQVCSLVLVDDVGLSQLVKHLLNLRVQSDSLFLVSHGAQLTNGIAHGLCIILVVKRPFLLLADSLHG